MITSRFSDTIYLDMDGVICDFVGRAIEVLGPSISGIGTPEREQSINDCQNIPGFYLDLDPIPGAIDGYHKLSDKFDVYILSAPSWDNPTSWGDKRRWCEKYLGDKVYKKIILTHNKGLFTGRALIDDRIKYGVDMFDGEHIHFGTDKFPDWNSVIKYLI